MSLHITKHQGKMKGFMSLSTSTLTNEFCIAMRQKEGTICSKCYAARYETLRKNLHECLVRNSEMLSKPLAEEDVPVLDVPRFRINSFGELINKHHLDNIVRIAKKNPNTVVTLWTKRENLLAGLTEKPSNLIIIKSSPQVNKKATVKSKHIDKLFTVYDNTETTPINCSKSCATCLKCYTPSNTEFHISEYLK